LRTLAPKDNRAKASFVNVTQTFKEQAPGFASASAATTDSYVSLRGDESTLRPGLWSDYILSRHLPPRNQQCQYPSADQL
jgi:hypothetical protein